MAKERESDECAVTALSTGPECEKRIFCVGHRRRKVLGEMTEEEKECAICAEVIDGVDRVEAVGACNHRGVCSICFLRMRSLLKDYSCPMCKTELEFVVGVGPKQIKQGRDLYGHYNIWGDDAGPDHTFDHKSKMFLPKEYQRSAVCLLMY